MDRPFICNIGCSAGWLCLLSWAFAAISCAVPPDGPHDPDFDILIVGGQVIDGSGGDRYDASVGIRGGMIAWIGQDPSPRSANREIDATGRVVAPGFIDVHNHSLDGVLSEDWRGPQVNVQYLTQGVTTIVTGADGSWTPEQIRMIRERLRGDGSGVNYACYVGHNGIRRRVMGMDQQRAPSEAELRSMKALTREGMELGCVGLSTGLMYEPGMFSDRDEIVALATEVAPYGGTYDSHVRDPVRDLLGSQAEAIAIGRAAGIPVKLAHVKAVGLRNRGTAEQIIERIEAARGLGEEVVADQYPYNSAATHTLYELILFPGIERYYDALEHGEIDENELAKIIRSRLEDSQQRPQLKEYAEHGVDGGFSWIRMTGYGSMRILMAPESSGLTGKNILLLAQEREVDPFELVAELILDYEDPLLVTFGAIDEKDVRKLLVQPWVMVASDGFHVGPEQTDSSGHPRSTGTFTRVLGHYSRDLGLLTLEESVRKMTSLPADHLGLAGRGRIEVGAVADIVVFDPDTVIDRSTWADPDRYSVGIVEVLVNGETAVSGGAPTGIAAGRFVPRARH